MSARESGSRLVAPCPPRRDRGSCTAPGRVLPGSTAGHTVMELEAFWSDFALGYWERQPMARDPFFPAPPVGPEVLFETVVRCCELEHGKGEVDVRFYV